MIDFDQRLIGLIPCILFGAFFTIIMHSLITNFWIAQIIAFIVSGVFGFIVGMQMKDSKND